MKEKGLSEDVEECLQVFSLTHKDVDGKETEVTDTGDKIAVFQQVLNLLGSLDDLYGAMEENNVDYFIAKGGDGSEMIIKMI